MLQGMGGQAGRGRWAWHGMRMGTEPTTLDSDGG
jgi:hypothetical protein